MVLSEAHQSIQILFEVMLSCLIIWCIQPISVFFNEIVSFAWTLIIWWNVYGIQFYWWAESYGSYVYSSFRYFYGFFFIFNNPIFRSSFKLFLHALEFVLGIKVFFFFARFYMTYDLGVEKSLQIELIAFDIFRNKKILSS